MHKELLFLYSLLSWPFGEQPTKVVNKPKQIIVNISECVIITFHTSETELILKTTGDVKLKWDSVSLENGYKVSKLTQLLLRNILQNLVQF